MKSDRITSNLIYNSAYQLLIILVPLVTIPYLSRVLGASAVGEYSFTQSVTNYFVLFGVLGLARYGSRAIAAVSDDRAQLSKTFAALLRIQHIATGISILCYVLLILLCDPASRLIFLIWGIWVVSDLLDISWFFFGIENFKITAIRSSVIKIATLAAIFLLVRSPDDLWIYCMITAGGYFISAAVLWPLLPRYVDRCKASWALVRQHILPCLGLFLPTVATSLYTILDKVILGLLAPMDQLGYFEYAEKLSRVPLALITALGTVMLPRMSNALAHDDKRQADRYLSGTIQLATVVALAFAFGISAVSPEFVPLFFGEAYEPAIPLMMLLSAIIPIVAWSNVTGVQYLLPHFRDRAFTLSVCVGAAVNITVNLLLIPSFQAMGAVIATISAELSVLIVQLAFIRDRGFIKAGVKTLLPFMVAGLLMFTIVRIVSGAMPEGIVGLLIEIFIGMAVYGCITAGILIRHCIIKGALRHRRG